MTTQPVQAIHVQGLEKSYKKLEVLRGVDFDVARGLGDPFQEQKRSRPIPAEGSSLTTHTLKYARPDIPLARIGKAGRSSLDHSPAGPKKKGRGSKQSPQLGPHRTFVRG
jgi:hypothetical protein